MFVYLLCLGFILSHSTEAEIGACEDATTEPLCKSPCVWFVDEGEGECLEASEVPAGATEGNVGGITLKFCDRITERTECFGYAIDPAEYEAGDPLVVTKLPKEVAVCTWNPSLDICASAIMAEGAGAGAVAPPTEGGEIPEPEGMGFGGESPEIGQQTEIGEQPEMGEGSGTAAGQNVATGDSGATGTGVSLTNEQSEYVSEMIQKAVEMYSEMAPQQTAAGGTGEAQEAAEIEPPKAETYCPTITEPEKCMSPCIWATTQCIELDRLILRNSNPLPEESNPLPEESTKIPVWKLATFALIGLLIGVIAGTAYAQCRHKETNNDVFVPLDRHV